MGTETAQPDVEESTEPPPRAPLHEGTTPTPGQAIDCSVPSRRCLDDREKKAADPEINIRRHSSAATTSTTCSQVECKWDEQYEFAHTLTPSDIALILNVDLQ